MIGHKSSEPKTCNGASLNDRLNTANLSVTKAMFRVELTATVDAQTKRHLLLFEISYTNTYHYFAKLKEQTWKAYSVKNCYHAVLIQIFRTFLSNDFSPVCRHSKADFWQYTDTKNLWYFKSVKRHSLEFPNGPEIRSKRVTRSSVLIEFPT